MNQAAERLQQASHKLAEAMYKQSAGGDGQPGGTAESGDGGGGDAGSPPKDDVIDAEFEDKQS